MAQVDGRANWPIFISPNPQNHEYLLLLRHLAATVRTFTVSGSQCQRAPLPAPNIPYCCGIRKAVKSGMLTQCGQKHQERRKGGSGTRSTRLTPVKILLEVVFFPRWTGLYFEGEQFDRVKGQTVGWRLSRTVKVWGFVRRDAVRECSPTPEQPESIWLARDWRA